MLKCATSLWSADLTNLAAEIQRVEPYSEVFHLDVADGHYVNALLFFPDLVKALRKHTKKLFDVHLMVTPVDPLIPAYVEAGADTLSFHPEAGPHIHRTIQLIKHHGKRAGCVLNPGTPLAAIETVLGDLDLVLVMSVNPGFGGQAFLSSQLAKIAALRKAIDALGKPIDLEVDGGVNPETARRCTKAGADVLVAGTAVFSGGPDRYAANIKALRS